MSTNGQRSLISLTDLPSNALVEILARLPLRTLFVARSVCKTLGFLSTPNPHFINLYSSNAYQILVVQFEGYFGNPSCLIHMADHELDYKNYHMKPLFQLPRMCRTVEQYRDSYFPELNKLFLVNSCNGLLYFRQNGPFDSLVCNPITSEYIIIPYVVVDPRMRICPQTQSFCLGFSPGSNQYKVLRIFSWERIAAGPLEFAAQVFVIGSDSWRDIPPYYAYFPWDLCQTQNVNGLRYWHEGSGAIISFDFEREKFGEVALPHEYQFEGFLTKHETSIGVLGGCLCLSCNCIYFHRVYLWVMRNCGNQQSWTKEFVVDTITLGPRHEPICGQLKPLQFLRNGEILMQWRENTLVCFNPRTKILRYFRFDGDNLGHKVVALTPRFVPLKDALKVDEVLTQLKPRGDEKDQRLAGGSFISLFSKGF